jgi:ParB-like chromosome segregation protein Spo0J
MEWHPYAKLFPMLSEAELQSLADDIGANGQRHPIIVDPKNRIIDGRNRAAACEIAQVKPVTTVFDGSDREVLAMVVSENIHRRHLSDKQRAMIAAEIANLPAHRPSDKSADRRTSSEPVVTQEEAAELMNVPERTLQRARMVKVNAVPEVQDAVVNEDLPLTKAEAIARLPKEDQPKALKAVREGNPVVEPAATSGRTPVGVIKANEALNCLKAIPKNDALRKRGFQIVTDWIKHNSKES